MERGPLEGEVTEHLVAVCMQGGGLREGRSVGAMLLRTSRCVAWSSRWPLMWAEARGVGPRTPPPSAWTPDSTPL